jgi:hypothetical protein
MNEDEIAKQKKSVFVGEASDKPDSFLLTPQKNHGTPKMKRKHSFRFRLIASICASLVLIIGGYAVLNLFFEPHATGPLARQIDKYFVPFNASKYLNSSCPPLHGAISYDDLLNDTYEGAGEASTVILCTVSNIGIYRDKSEKFNPSARFGHYIYSVR